MGLFGELGKLLVDTAKETIVDAWNSAEAKVEAIENKKQEYILFDYDLICEMIEKPDEFELSEIDHEALKVVKQERDNIFQNLDNAEIMSELPDEWLKKMHESKSFWSSENYATAMRYIVIELQKPPRKDLYQEIIDEYIETYEDADYCQLMEYRDDYWVQNSPIEKWAVDKVLEARNERIEELSSTEFIEDLDNSDFIEYFLDLKFYREEWFGEKGDGVYLLYLKELADNRDFLINKLLEQIQDSEEYQEDFDFENKSSKWILNALKDEKTYDAIDRIIMTQILESRGVKYE